MQLFLFSAQNKIKTIGHIEAFCQKKSALVFSNFLNELSLRPKNSISTAPVPRSTT